jgi:CheY-like chemotaxis protein
MAKVLIVDDEEGIRSVLADALESAGHETVQAQDVETALLCLDDQPFDILLSDLRMPGTLDGMDLVRRTRARWPDMQVIVLTAHGSVGTAVEAIKLGAFDFIEKPISSPADLRALVRRALNWRSAPRHVPAMAVDASRVATAPVGESRGPTEGGPAAAPVSWLRDFLFQAKRRHVYTVAVGYLAVGFLLLQGAQLVLVLPFLPSWLYPAFVGLTVAGFPVALVLGWIYDITRKGIRRTDTLDTEGADPVVNPRQSAEV